MIIKNVNWFHTYIGSISKNGQNMRYIFDRNRNKKHKQICFTQAFWLSINWLREYDCNDLKKWFCMRQY